MLESNLKQGNQNFPPSEGVELEYGLSITDGCIDWETTEELIRAAYQQLA
jgi:3-deoxy-7-phosphoheptulonate synthase